MSSCLCFSFFFFFQAEDGIRDLTVTGVHTCALPILGNISHRLGGLHAMYKVRPFGGNEDAADTYDRFKEHMNANGDRKSTRLNSSHSQISYAVFCLKKKKKKKKKKKQKKKKEKNNDK